jgi:hypothetical protein
MHRANSVRTISPRGSGGFLGNAFLNFGLRPKQVLFLSQISESKEVDADWAKGK